MNWRRKFLNIPEQGQVVSVRNRYFIVNNVDSYDSEDISETYHKLKLECLDDDMMGEEIEVIWELELESSKKVIDVAEIPRPEKNKFDTLETFNAFINAINWSKNSLIVEDQFISPYRSAIMLKDYQLEPLARAISMPRANLLIADDVGLGKTIEAGLIIQEFLAQQRISRILIVCPASLQRQWKEEMEEKFNLIFEIINRDSILRLRREYGMHMNPWNFYPRLITSMDFLKREMPKRYFFESLKSKRKGFSIKDWDLLIIDEAHNVAPSGKKNYMRDSDRTKMARDIVKYFEHRLFLTATPHNGFTPSFTSLLEMLDPLKFTGGLDFDRKYLRQVMVRRLKDELEDELGRKMFTKRIVDPISVKNMDENEKKLFSILNEYTDSRLSRLHDTGRFAVTFTLTILKKRLLSSPFAFHNSIEKHMEGLKSTDEEKDDRYVKNLQLKTLEEWDDDAEKSEFEDEAIQESSKYFADLTDNERRYLEEMERLSKIYVSKNDTKVETLLSWIKSHLFSDGEWNNERLVVFTEYRDTLEYLQGIFEKLNWNDRYLMLYGGMAEKDRESIKKAFQNDPEENNVRILLATDAASEGLNLQNHCRYLIHYEIPWNPNKMEQRNGRIDRVGQNRDVTVYHFLYENHEDSEYLNTVVRKIDQMRQDLGSVGEIIAEQVENRMLGLQKDRELTIREGIWKKIKIIREENKSERITKEEIRKLRLKRERTGEALDIKPGSISKLLKVALSFDDGSLEPITEGDFKDRGFRISKLPNQWHDMKQYVYSGSKRLVLVFDHKDNIGKNTVFLHLNHPVIKKAINVFRENIWKTDIYSGSVDVNRCSYKIVSDNVTSKLHMLVFARLVATNKKGIKLHEDLLVCGGEVNKSEIIFVDESDLWSLFKSEGKFSEIPISVGDHLREFFPSHKKSIDVIIDDIKDSKKGWFVSILKKKADEEAKYIRSLIEERIKELEARKEKIKEQSTRLQLTLDDFSDEEKEQWDEDVRRLDTKYEEYKSSIEQEPEKAKERYELNHFDIYPMATFYVIPESLTKEAK